MINKQNIIPVNPNWHSDTKQAYLEMIIENYLLQEKPIYKFNKETLVLGKIKEEIDYCI